MVRWKNALVLFLCTTTPMLAQATKPSDSAGQTHASQPGSTAHSPDVQTTAAPSAAIYPLDSFREFSAIMIGSRAEPGEGTSLGHIYRSGGKLRMEEPGALAYFITDLDIGETYGILETGCMHDDHPYFRAIPFYIAGRADATLTRASAGKEIVDRHSCQVEDITLSSPTFPSPQKMRFWEAEDLQGFPIKIEFLLPGGRDPIIRYKNVVLGQQDRTLFIHPKSCQSLSQGSSGP